MPAKTGSRNGLAYGWALGENNWNVGMDGNLSFIDRFGLHLSFKSFLNTPPGSPAAGDCYVIDAAPTDAWVGKTGQVAVYDDGAWRYGLPRTGWLAYCEADDSLYVFDGVAWSIASGEWSADTVSQLEAEAGTATTRRAWTAQRVRQAIAAWWDSIDAPQDSKQYARKDGAWAEVVSSSGGGTLSKADRSTPCLVKTGGGTLAVKAGTTVYLSGGVVSFASQTTVTMPALTAGEDYSVWVLPDGTAQAVADPFSAPASAPAAGALKIGGFHYGLVAPGTTPAGGSFATSGFSNTGGNMVWTQADVDRIAGINEFSIWDLSWRCKGQQRGMALDPQTEVWHAIYFCSVNHILNGISRYNTDVASGTVPPRIPLAFGGNGSTNYGRLSQYECEEIAASFGLRLPDPHEFRSAMFGVTEAQSLGGAASTIAATARQPGYTSRIGVEQATGHQLIFARGNSAAGGSAWLTGPNRGQSYGNPWVILLGGARVYAANSGSRASYSDVAARFSDWSGSLRAAGDHYQGG